MTVAKKPTAAKPAPSDSERASALKATDPRVHLAALTRADLRVILHDAGLVGAARLRRPDADRLYVEHAKHGAKVLQGIRVNAAGKVEPIAAQAKPPAKPVKPPVKAKAPAKAKPAAKASPAKRAPRKAAKAA